jgi:hypothetical protein
LNTKGIARHYDRLTPRERLPLIIAASVRGDETERERLVHSAPRVGYRLPDYHGMAEGMQLLALLHLGELLDLAALLWRASLPLTDPDDCPGKEGKERKERALGTVRMFAYLFTVSLDGWNRFCSDLKVEPPGLLNDLPGWATVNLSANAARRVAFSPEEATAWLRKGTDEPAEARTAESVAAELQQALEHWEARWA